MNGKGSKYRPYDYAKWSENYDRIFMKTIYDLPGYSPEFVEKLRGFHHSNEGALLNCGEENTKKTTSIMIRLFNEIKPEHILEVGTNKGYFCYFCALYDSKIKIDTFELYGEVAEKGIQAISDECGININFYVGDSLETLGAFSATYKIDFAWIDGAHNLVNVTADLDNCGRLGIKTVMVDDYNMQSVRQAVDVFSEIDNYELVEIKLSNNKSMALLGG